MTSDLELLQNYARNKSEESFTALLNRHLNLVYSAGLRQVRSPQLAEEVVQSARKIEARSRAACALSASSFCSLAEAPLPHSPYRHCLYGLK